MNFHKSLASVLIATGCLVLLSGVALQVRAVECTPSEFKDGLACDSAHAVNHYSAPGVSGACSPGGGTGCTPSSGSDCEDLDGYEIALSGKCVADFYGNYYGCVDEYGVTSVAIDFVFAVCDTRSGACACSLYTNTSIHPTQFVQVCDCY